MFAKNHFGIFCFSNFHKYAKMVDEIFRNAKSAKISRLFSAAIIQIIPYNPCKIIQKKNLFPFILKEFWNFYRKYQNFTENIFNMQNKSFLNWNMQFFDNNIFFIICLFLEESNLYAIWWVCRHVTKITPKKYKENSQELKRYCK